MEEQREKEQRLDKLLSNSLGLGRSAVKEYIKKGRVKINAVIAKSPEQKVSAGDEVCFDGKPVNTAKYRYFMLNKPDGVVSATEDGGCKTVTDILKPESVKDLFPVGRLDKDTVGLLIMTNDGELAHFLTAPSRHVDKVYEARVDKEITKEHIEAFARGFEFKEFTSAPAVLEVLQRNPDNGESLARVTVHEGKFHEVKRLFARVGMNVLSLKRVAFGPLILDSGLSEGEYRELTDGEVDMLRSACSR